MCLKREFSSLLIVIAGRWDGLLHLLHSRRRNTRGIEWCKWDRTGVRRDGSLHLAGEAGKQFATNHQENSGPHLKLNMEHGFWVARKEMFSGTALRAAVELCLLSQVIYLLGRENKLVNKFIVVPTYKGVPIKKCPCSLVGISQRD